ncbi:MAG TPA: ribose 5-phosphate isomerase B [Chroococcales cyanobacterium]
MEKIAKIALGSDHAGFDLKEQIRKYLIGKGIEVDDKGTNSKESCDYPQFARAVAESVATGEVKRGIVCCGSGIGVSIVANKVRGARAALCHDVESATLSRQHNNSNVLALSGRTFDWSSMEQIIDAWLSTDFEGGRHERRVEQIEHPREGEGAGAWKERRTRAGSL